jgi:hypothetical protein
MDTDKGVISCIVRPPKGGLIELVSPIDVSKQPAQELESFLGSKGEGIMALHLSASEDVPQRDFKMFGTSFSVS